MNARTLPFDPPLSRSEFLKLLAGAGAILISGGPNMARAAGAILTRPIPKSGEALPAVGLGTSITFDVGRGREERAPVREVIRLFFEAGGKLIDTAPTYGEAEAVTAELLAELGARKKAFIATKVSTHGREEGLRQMNESARRFGADPIDLIQVHNLQDTEIHLRTLREWQGAGKIRYIGITHYRPSALDELARWVRREPMEFVQCEYSIEAREAEDRLLPTARDRDVAVLVNRPYGRGRLFRAVRGHALPPWAKEFDCASWGQFFLKYILSHPAVTCILPATRQPRHLLDNMAAGRGRLPDAAQRKKMVELWKAL